MRRKIIGQGLGGCTVSLPINWIRETKLSAGSEVDIQQSGDSLMVRAAGERAVKSAEIILSDLESKDQLRTIIASHYKAGYQEMILIFEKLPDLSELDKTVATFTGLEITEQGAKKIIIRSFIEEKQIEIEQMIVKMFQTIRMMGEEIRKGPVKSGLENMEFLSKKNMIKLRDHCLRTIHMTKFGDDHTYDLYDLVTILEKIAAEYLTIYVSAVSGKGMKMGGVLNALDVFDRMYRVYLKKGFRRANRVWNLIERETLKEYDEKKLGASVKRNGHAAVHGYHLLRLFRHLSSRLLALNS